MADGPDALPLTVSIIGNPSSFSRLAFSFMADGIPALAASNTVIIVSLAQSVLLGLQLSIVSN